MNRMNYQVDTTLSADRTSIAQSVSTNGPLIDATHRMTHHLVQLQEQGVRNALIAAGWTPPEGAPEVPQTVTQEVLTAHIWKALDEHVEASTGTSEDFRRLIAHYLARTLAPMLRDGALLQALVKERMDMEWLTHGREGADEAVRVASSQVQYRLALVGHASDLQMHGGNPVAALHFAASRAIAMKDEQA